MQPTLIWLSESTQSVKLHCFKRKASSVFEGSKNCLTISGVGGGSWCRGCRRTPKVFICQICEKLDKIYENVSKIPEILGKLPENTDTNSAQHCLILKNWHPHEDLFLRSSQKWSVWEEILTQRIVQTFFGQVWGNSGKHLSYPQNLPAPTSMIVITLLPLNDCIDFRGDSEYVNCKLPLSLKRNTRSAPLAVRTSERGSD